MSESVAAIRQLPDRVGFYEVPQNHERIINPAMTACGFIFRNPQSAFRD